jgi:hypothetical protein
MPRAGEALGVSELLPTRAGISVIEEHLLDPRFLDVGAYGGCGMAPANEEMLERLQAAAAEGRALAGADAAFYQHELYESQLMAQGMEAPAAHAKALADLGHDAAQLYDRDVVRNHPEWFSKPYFDYWGIPWPFSS